MSLTGSKLAFVTDSSAFDTLHSTASVNTGDYVHVVVTRDQTTGEKKIYVNGALDASDVAETGVLGDPSEMEIGANSGTVYNGEMDDIQIYSGVLSATDVSNLYNNPGTTIADTTGGGGGSVITGSITNQPDYQIYTISDGTHSVDFLWSEALPGSTAWIYGTYNTSVALATGITNITQITNAADYSFSTSSIGPVSDADANGGIGQFVVLQSTSGYYAVVRIDDVQDDDTLNATWWFQTDGTGDFSSFAPPSSLGDAVNATNLTWTTSGDSSWFVESTNTHDGVLAAQSGSVTGYQSSTLQTTVTGPGTLTFWWKTSADDDGFDLEFDMDDEYVDDLYDNQDWIQESSVSIPSGTHTLAWTAYADYTDSSDAGWVDQVAFTPEAAPVSVSLDLQINRSQDFIYAPDVDYYAYPEITSISPAPVTTNRVESPDGGTFGEVWAGHSSWDIAQASGYYTLDQMIQAYTNGQWTIYINKGDPSEQIFHFSVSINGLTTNLLAAVNILVPMNNAANVATNSPFQWSGPATFSSISVNAYQFPSYAYIGAANLPGSATNWPSPPALPYGTNAFYVSCTSNNFPNVTFTTPVDDSMNPISSWSTEVDLKSSVDISFVVGAPAPLPVQLTGSPPQTSAGNFQLSFQTLAGRPHTIQVRTNLIGGAWVDVTNFIGDGSTQQFTFPTTNTLGGFFRVITQ